jgi:hypothetical protein
MKKIALAVWNHMIAIAEARDAYYRKHGFSAWY